MHVVVVAVVVDAVVIRVVVLVMVSVAGVVGSVAGGVCGGASVVGASVVDVAAAAAVAVVAVAVAVVDMVVVVALIVVAVSAAGVASGAFVLWHVWHSTGHATRTIATSPWSLPTAVGKKHWDLIPSTVHRGSSLSPLQGWVVLEAVVAAAVVVAAVVVEVASKVEMDLVVVGEADVEQVRHSSTQMARTLSTLAGSEEVAWWQSVGCRRKHWLGSRITPPHV